MPLACVRPIDIIDMPFFLSSVRPRGQWKTNCAIHACPVFTTPTTAERPERQEDEKTCLHQSAITITIQYNTINENTLAVVFFSITFFYCDDKINRIIFRVLGVRCAVCLAGDRIIRCNYICFHISEET